ncbi:hypothetical protein T06_15559 [Trichinella sp. T6]|nr:hypothetical protein T06_15559 [Trichinella sp. T6]
MRAVYPILQRDHVEDVRHGPKMDFSKVYRSIFEVPRQENSKKLMLWACKSSFRKDIRLVGGGGLSAIIRLENKLPPAATSHPMNLLTACRCP